MYYFRCSEKRNLFIKSNNIFFKQFYSSCK